jgi:hypothetical protein
MSGFLDKLAGIRDAVTGWTNKAGSAVSRIGHTPADSARPGRDAEAAVWGEGNPGPELAEDLLDEVSDWTKDRIEDVTEAVGRVGDRLGDSATAGWTGANQLWDATAGFAGHTWQELRQGRLPQIAEIAGYWLLMTGLEIGVAANIASSTDHHLFAQGQPEVGTPIINVGTSAGSVPAPTDLNSLIDTMMDCYNGNQGVRITAVRNPGQPGRYIVSIPGVTADPLRVASWSGEPNGRDWPANLWVISTGASAFLEGARQAIAEAISLDRASHGEPASARSEILMDGHSQGGIIAVNLACDPDFAAQYDIRAIITAGSPIECAEIPSTVAVLSMQNGHFGETAAAVPGMPADQPVFSDPIPELDLDGINILGAKESHPSVTEVELTPIVTTDRFGNHIQAAYNATIDAAHGTSAQQIHDFEQAHDLAAFYATDPATTTTYDVPIGVTFPESR